VASTSKTEWDARIRNRIGLRITAIRTAAMIMIARITRIRGIGGVSTSCQVNAFASLVKADWRRRLKPLESVL